MKFDVALYRKRPALKFQSFPPGVAEAVVEAAEEEVAVVEAAVAESASAVRAMRRLRRHKLRQGLSQQSTLSRSLRA